MENVLIVFEIEPYLTRVQSVENSITHILLLNRKPTHGINDVGNTLLFITVAKLVALQLKLTLQNDCVAIDII